MSGYTIGEIAVWLVLAAVLGFVLGWLVRELQHRASRRRDTPVVETPPVAETRREPSPEPAATVGAAPAEDGAAPSPEHVIKGNTSSKIYHGPGSPSYARMKAGIWFRTEAEAEEAGYRRPRNA